METIIFLSILFVVLIVIVMNIYFQFNEEIKYQNLKIELLESQMKNLHSFIEQSDIPEKKRETSRNSLRPWPTNPGKSY